MKLNLAPQSLFVFIISYFMLFSGLSVADETEAIIKLTEATLTLSDASNPPNLLSGKTVSLPDYWIEEPLRYKTSNNGWYRFSVNLEKQPLTLWGIYLQRFNMNAAIYLNGQFLIDGGSFEPLSRNWNYPLYVNVPSSLWQKGENIIYVRVKSDEAYGSLTPIFIGPVQILEPEYKLQTLLKNEIDKVIFPIMFIVSLFIFSLWLRRREDVKYLWFSASVFMWSIFSLNMFVKHQPFSTKIWEWIAHTSLDWWVILFAIFVHRYTGQQHPKLERAYLLFGFIAAFVYAVIDLKTMVYFTSWFHAGSLLIGFILLAGLAKKAINTNSKTYAVATIAMVLLLLLGINDWLFQFMASGITEQTKVHLHHYFSPLVFLFMAWHLTARFASALQEAETLNSELETRVKQAHNQIEQHYQTIQKMENQQAVLQEQKRLSREIHDGISGNVSNAIMVTELLRKNSSNNNQQQLHQLRSLLDDGLTEIRNLILTMENDLCTLSELSIHINDKYAQLLSATDIDFQSNISLLKIPRKLTQKESLNLLRILQETLNNIVQHAQALQVTLQIKEDDKQVVFTVIDNGQGFDASKKHFGHYGLINMQKRCDEINAQLKISSVKNSHTQIQLTVSLNNK